MPTPACPISRRNFLGNSAAAAAICVPTFVSARALGLEPGFDQASDFVRDHPRLARTGTRQHQAGAGDEVHGFELGVVESG